MSKIDQAKSTYLSGPWRFEPIRDWPFGFVITDAGGNEVIRENAIACNGQQRTREQCESGFGFQKGSRERANALVAQQDAIGHLIAAAPDILGALEDMICHSCLNRIGQIEAHARHILIPGGYDWRMCAACVMPRFFVAKAKGQHHDLDGHKCRATADECVPCAGDCGRYICAAHCMAADGASLCLPCASQKR